MFLYLIGLFFLAVIIPTVIGYSIWFRRVNIADHSSLERIIWSLMIGVAIEVVILQSLNWLMPLKIASWLLLLLMFIVVTYRFTYVIEIIKSDARSIFYTIQGKTTAVIAIAVIFIFYFPILEYGYLTSYEATGNHDSIHYITTARWLVNNAFNTPVTWSPEHPVFYMARNAVSLKQEFGLPRVGAETLLAAWSLTLGLDPYQLFSATSGIFAFYWVAAARLLIEKFTPEYTESKKIGAFLVASTSPALIFIVANSNYATLLGCVFFTTTVTWLSSEVHNKSGIAVGALLISSLFGIYADLLPALGLSLIIFLGIKIILLRRYPFRLSNNIILAFLVSALFTPWIWNAGIDALNSIRRVASTQGSGFRSMFDGLSTAESLSSYIVLNRKFAELLSTPFDWLLTILIGLVLIIGIPKNRKAISFVSVIFTLLIYAIYVNWKGFNYGKFKISEYFSIYIAVCLGLGLMSIYQFSLTKVFIPLTALLRINTLKHRLPLQPLQATDSEKSKKSNSVVMTGFLGLVMLLSVFGFWITSEMSIIFSSYAVAKQRFINSDLALLQSDLNGLPSNNYVYVANDLGKESFYNSMWIGYFLQNRNILYSDSSYAGGYFNAAVRGSVLNHVNDVDYVLEGKAVDSIFSNSCDAVIYENLTFRVLDTKNACGYIISTNGVSKNEGAFSWMGRSAHLNIVNTSGGYINVVINGQFPNNNNSNDRLIVETKDHKFSTFVENGRTQFSVKLGIYSEQSVVIRPTINVVSPRSIGVGGDDRPLSYQLREISLSKAPRYKVAGVF